MLRISKIADYGVVLATHLALSPSEESHSVSSLAAATGVPEPTTAKVLKLLSSGGVVSSRRGAYGGYRLSRPADQISVADLVTALEGPIAVTECSDDVAVDRCDHEGSCDVRANWQRINVAVHEALSAISLADMTRPLVAKLIPRERLLAGRR